MVQFSANNFVSSVNAQAAIDKAANEYAGLWVTGQSVTFGIRSIVQELLKQDPSQESITLGTEEAKALYDMVKAATAQSAAEQNPISNTSAHTAEGLPSHAQALGEIAARAHMDVFWTGGPSTRPGTINARPTGFAESVDQGGLKIPGLPDNQKVTVRLSKEFNSTIRDMMAADAVGALASSPDLASRAASAEKAAQNKFLTTKNVRSGHGGHFKRFRMRNVAELPASERARLATTRELATLGAVFGFKDAGVRRPTLGQCGCG